MSTQTQVEHRFNEAQTEHSLNRVPECIIQYLKTNCFHSEPTKALALLVKVAVRMTDLCVHLDKPALELQSQ